MDLKDVVREFEVDGKKYTLAFNLNSMADIEKKYGSIAKWGKLVDASNKEINIDALRYGLTAMLNEGIDMNNEKNGTNEPFLTERQTGRIIMALSAQKAAETMNDLVIESVKTEPKNT